MTLIERAESLRERIKKVKDLEAKKNITANASEKSKKVKELRESFATQRERARSLGLQPHTVTWPPATDSQAALDEYKAALEKEKDPSAPSVEDAYRTLIQASAPVENDARGLVEAHIVEARAQLAAVDRSALDAWKTLQTDTTKLDATLSEFDRLLKMTRAQWLKLPPSLLSATLLAKAAVMKAVDTLMAGSMPPEVQVFLKDARDSGARVEQFTDAVKAWLTTNKQLGRVRVVFK